MGFPKFSVCTHVIADFIDPTCLESPSGAGIGARAEATSPCSSAMSQGAAFANSAGRQLYDDVVEALADRKLLVSSEWLLACEQAGGRRLPEVDFQPVAKTVAPVSGPLPAAVSHSHGLPPQHERGSETKRRKLDLSNRPETLEAERQLLDGIAKPGKWLE
ncbi:unnamed protein product [Protopolystoma xenopodis]|uniref:BRCT domain-containing protein n=1 Tax=Protopolystoma xenopodis TaxID=117903 RepID=A0A3S5BUX9_9PLAT|nr:unnamed protein product [Protopolystoma xenopodis]